MKQLFASARQNGETHPWLVAATVMLAVFMEVLDTSVAHAERVVLAFAARRKRRQTVILLDGMEQRSSPRQHLVGVRLMSHIPDQPVVRSIEHIVQGDGQFDGSHPGCKMAA